MHTAKLISITPDAEAQIAYCARVSSPNQTNPEYTKLLRYCIKHGHWSVFETASMCIEIQTNRAISPQILRHRSFSFQEFSQRYATVTQEIPRPDFRLAGSTNRQSSLPLPDWHELTDAQQERIKDAWRVIRDANEAYTGLIDAGIATETARNILPLCTPTRLYMAGNIRDWLHYVNVRTAQDTQLEHRLIAEAIKAIICEQLPVVYDAMWGKL